MNRVTGNTRVGWRAVGATPSRLSRLRPAFTLTELLIVIGLIVLIIALAVPAFNAMTGGRSVDAATNTLSAMLGRVRMEAIGLQEPRGLLFYRDPATQRIGARMVRAAGSGPANSGIIGFEIVPDRDPMLLPVGVGLQMVDDALMTGSGPGATARDDRYIGYNTMIGTNRVRTPVGGMILFDQNGRLTSRRYGFRVKQPGKRPNTLEDSDTGRFLYGEGNTVPGNNEVMVAFTPGNTNILRTQFGFVLFDEEPFKNKFGTADDPFGDKDPQIDRSSNSGRELGTTPDTEEGWLDQNATPILINRYNGTLIRGE